MKEIIKKLTLPQILSVIVLITFIFLTIIFGVKNIKNSKEKKELNKFNDYLIAAAKNYINDNHNEFLNFLNYKDITVISTAELIENGYIDKEVHNPTGREIINYYIRATINEDNTILYEVVG